MPSKEEVSRLEVPPVAAVSVTIETEILARLDRIDAQERLRDEAGDPDRSRLRGNSVQRASTAKVPGRRARANCRRELLNRILR